MNHKTQDKTEIL